MNQQPSKRISRSSGDRLDAVIRQALEDRIGDHQPSEHGRQVLMARVREASQPKQRIKKRLLSRPAAQGRAFPISSVMWAYTTGQGFYRRDSHLSLAISSFTNPLLGLIR